MWLTTEAGFRHVRIHSFGYDSDWTRLGRSVLGLRDFAQNLVANIHNSEVLRRNGEVKSIQVHPSNETG